MGDQTEKIGRVPQEDGHGRASKTLRPVRQQSDMIPLVAETPESERRYRTSISRRVRYMASSSTAYWQTHDISIYISDPAASPRSCFDTSGGLQTDRAHAPVAARHYLPDYNTLRRRETEVAGPSHAPAVLLRRRRLKRQEVRSAEDRDHQVPMSLSLTVRL